MLDQETYYTVPAEQYRLARILTILFGVILPLGAGILFLILPEIQNLPIPNMVDLSFLQEWGIPDTEGYGSLFVIALAISIVAGIALNVWSKNMYKITIDTANAKIMAKGFSKQKPITVHLAGIERFNVNSKDDKHVITFHGNGKSTSLPAIQGDQYSIQPIVHYLSQYFATRKLQNTAALEQTQAQNHAATFKNQSPLSPMEQSENIRKLVSGALIIAAIIAALAFFSESGL